MEPLRLARVLIMRKRLYMLPLLMLLAGCVTHYHAPPRTVIYRDMNGLTSGVYDEQPGTVYRDVSANVASSVYYPWWSLDYFYLGHGYGSNFGFGYRAPIGYGFGYGYGYDGPYFGFSYSSGYGYPGPWYGFYYDPWYYPPYRYSWYAPYGHYWGYGHYAWNAPYWNHRYRHHHRSGHRDHDSRYDHWDGDRRRNAVLDPGWQRNEDQRRTWRGNNDDAYDRPGRGGSRDNRRGADSVAMPAGSDGLDRGMVVRSRPDAKQEVTRSHRQSPASSAAPEARRDEPRTVRYTAGSQSSRPGDPAMSIRRNQQSKSGPVRARPVDPPVQTPDGAGRRSVAAAGNGILSHVPGTSAQSSSIRSAGAPKAGPTRTQPAPRERASGKVASPVLRERNEAAIPIARGIVSAPARVPPQAQAYARPGGMASPQSLLPPPSRAATGGGMVPSQRFQVAPSPDGRGGAKAARPGAETSPHRGSGRVSSRSGSNSER